jgi:hypothetical protein
VQTSLPPFSYDSRKSQPHSLQDPLQRPGGYIFDLEYFPLPSLPRKTCHLILDWFKHHPHSVYSIEIKYLHRSFKQVPAAAQVQVTNRRSILLSASASTTTTIKRPRHSTVDIRHSTFGRYEVHHGLCALRHQPPLSPFCNIASLWSKDLSRTSACPSCISRSARCSS